MKRHYDAILLLGLKLNLDGTPRQELQLRIQKTADCYFQGFSDRVIVCGGQTPDTPVSEAEVMRDALIRLHVPAESIQLENRSQLTVENFINARSLLTVSHPRVLIVTSDYHMLRARLICRFSAGMRSRGCKARIPRELVRIQRMEEPLHVIDYLLGYQSGRRQRPEWYLKLMYSLFDINRKRGIR